MLRLCYNDESVAIHYAYRACIYHHTARSHRNYNEERVVAYEYVDTVDCCRIINFRATVDIVSAKSACRYHATSAAERSTKLESYLIHFALAVDMS